MLLVITCMIIIYIFVLVHLIQGLQRLGGCTNEALPAVTVIVAARNEGKYIENCIKSLLGQDYPADSYEILLVNDASGDNTRDIMQRYASEHENIRAHQIAAGDRYQGSKKRALETGIAAAKGDLLLFTDADCEPPPAWAREMVRCFQDDVGAVAGFSPLVDPSGSWFGKIAHVDSHVSGIIAAGGIGAGGFVTCTGRSLAYRKQAFEDAGGFTDIHKSLSGDDDLLMHQLRAKTSWKIAFNISPAAVVPSFQTKSWSEMISQKSRHLSAGRYYPITHKILYSLMHLIRFSAFAFLLSSIFFTRLFPIFMFAALIIIGWDYTIIRLGSRIMRQKTPRYIWLWEVYYLVYYWFSAFSVFFGRVRWIK
ncbi:MAG: glycosyltransferase [candidate division KSB1 bacterium]|jgi:cellulose synthase/poly-beta-1,6-N-acetylglucosamine synthase-like glycosyltransferase|nr:glycosyltransferase [candidate division KSB1 bacterium]